MVHWPGHVREEQGCQGRVKVGGYYGVSREVGARAIYVLLKDVRVYVYVHVGVGFSYMNDYQGNAFKLYQSIVWRLGEQAIRP